MRLLAFCSALLPAFAMAATATAQTFTTTQCYTARGRSCMGSLPTESSTLRSKIITGTQTVTNTPVDTVTPIAYTTTFIQTTLLTTTSVLLHPIGMVTQTKYDVSTTTHEAPTSTLVVTATSTSVISTTYAGFSPIQSTLPQASQVNNAVKIRRYAKPPVSKNNAHLFARAGSLPMMLGGDNATYPESLTCYVFVNVYYQKSMTVIAGTTSTTTLATPISTFDSMTTIVATLTSAPNDAATTTAITSTIISTVLSTPVATSTATVTVTNTAVVPKASAMCKSGNFANAVNGAGITSIYSNGEARTLYFYTGDADANACCQSCASNPDCSIFAFYSGFRMGKQCQMIQQPDEMCMPEDSSFAVTTAQAAGSGYTVGNGNCAVIGELGMDNSMAQGEL